jgi:SAM-dependent methyltransferase
MYDKDFFARRETGVLSSAGVIARHVMELLHNDALPPRSVLDIGCGYGAWLSAFEELGVQDAWGVDGSYVDPSALDFPAERFVAADLEAGLPPQIACRSFDLAVCLEVAEHLSKDAADRLIDQITSLTSVVLFSAAVPDQPGEGHINCQWQSYWLDSFVRKGFVAIDAVRAQVWRNQDVSWWYAQNAFLYVRKDRLKAFPRLQQHPAYSKASDGLVDVVHPRLMRLASRRRNPLRRLASLAARSLRHLIGRTWPAGARPKGRTAGVSEEAAP